MKKKTLLLVLALTMTCGVLAGCGKKEEAKDDTKEKVVADTSADTEEVNHDGMSISPLTGEWVDEAIANTQPVAIMIENTKVTLPQYGISKASVIYECPVEGGITRLMGIFNDYTDMDRIGNVRSCRPYYANIASEYSAFYFHAGASVEGDEILNSGIVKDINGLKGAASQYYFRTDDRKAPHNMYVSTDAIKNAIEACGYDTALEEGYTAHNIFAADGQTITLDDGIDAKGVSLYFFDNSPWFEYNDEDGLYYRYEFKDAQVDANNNEQIAVKNIILENITNTMYSEKKGTLNIDMISGGAGKYITNGKAIDITWARGDDNITRYYDASGTEITLNQGKTWISFVQSNYVDSNKFYATVDELKEAKSK